jgi:hypothetical protein
MKALHFPAIAVLGIALCHAAPLTAAPPQSADTNNAVNYVVKVEWKNADGTSSSLRLTTTEGSFDLNTLQKQTVKINNSDVPTTLKLNGTLTALSAEKGRLQLFLGRTVPYVTSSFPGPGGMTASSYQQMQVGLNSTFVVAFGKPMVIQEDDSGKVSILVTREKD